MAHLGKWTDNSRKASRKRSKREARWSGLRKTTAVLSEKSTQLVSATKDVAHSTNVAIKDRTASSSGSGRRMLVMTIAAALVGTIALPAYAMSPEAPQNDTYYSNFASQDTQNVDNTSEATISASRDGFTANAAVRQFSAPVASGPSYKQLLANPPNPNFSLSGIFNEGLKYIGTPYVSNGSTPAGFDCSGFTSYVYASFGVAIPRTSEGQRAVGTPISEADAQPGDIVWMPGHVGLWGGPGMILDSPVPGKTVSLRPIWTSNYQIIRIGI